MKKPSKRRGFFIYSQDCIITIMSIMSYRRSSANQRLGGENALTFASLLFLSILRLHAQQTPLKVFTECSLGPQFQIVQVDGPVERIRMAFTNEGGEAQI